MSVYKDNKTNSWYAITRYTDWTGKKTPKLKRGFSTKRDALKWEREFIEHKSADMDMLFESFVKIYAKDIQSRLKKNTWRTKDIIIQKKILPYFWEQKG